MPHCGVVVGALVNPTSIAVLRPIHGLVYLLALPVRSHCVNTSADSHFPSLANPSLKPFPWGMQSLFFNPEVNTPAGDAE